MITLDLPVPYSVNRTRKINWEYLKKHKQWMELADAIVMASRQHRQSGIVGPFQATITIDERRCKADPDNLLKALFDYCKRLKFVADDSPRFLREFRVKYGPTSQGIHIELSPHEPECPQVSGTKRRLLVNHLFRHPGGAGMEAILSVLYGDDPEGGGGRRSVWVTTYHANKQLRGQGWQITASGGPGSIYKLERIEKAVPEGTAESSS